MNNEVFNAVPEMESQPDNFFQLKSDILDMVYNELRLPVDSESAFVESLNLFFRQVGTSEDSENFRLETTKKLIGILRGSNPNEGDLNAAIAYLDNLIRHL